MPEDVDAADRSAPSPPEPKRVPFKDFLEKTPPGTMVVISNDALSPMENFHPARYKVNEPILDLYCDSCSGIRTFGKFVNNSSINPGEYPHSVDFRLRCRNCNKSVKLYSLLIKFDGKVCSIYKFGELPEFGPPTPPKVVKLIGPEREYYIKGRRSENQGLGIAAFAYYRRVVENQKDRIIGEIIKASRKIGVPNEMIVALEAAKAETQFSKAIDSVRDAVPQILLINGQNPLTLLHSALSEGLHAQTDDECLELATSIRVVLSELAERIGDALRDHAELNAAVTRLLSAKAKKISLPE